MKITLRPNVDTPLQTVLKYRDQFDELGIYSYVFHNNREPNTFGRLYKEGFWHAIGKPVLVETGALNENSLDPNTFIDEIAHQHKLLGALMKGVQFDETLFKLTHNGVKEGKIAQMALPIFQYCQERGIETHVIEPYPAMRFDQIWEYLAELTFSGIDIQRFVLDFDNERFSREMPERRWYHRLLGLGDPATTYLNDFNRELESFRDSLESELGIEFGVIIGSPAPGSGSFLANAQKQWDRLRWYGPGVVTVQSWENPPNFPSMTTLNDVINMVKFQ